MRIRETTCLLDLHTIANMLGMLDNFYPGFQVWLTHKVFGNLGTTTKILVAKEREAITGVAILKVGAKPKLRCLRVIPSHQNTGLGIKLIKESLEVLGTSKPRATVSEEMLHVYSRPFINYFGFELNEVSKGMYRKNKLEYIFN